MPRIQEPFMGVRVRDVVNKWYCVANRLERPDPDRGIASFPYTMYRGGMTDKKLDDEIQRTPAENSPWGRFLLETIRLDTLHKKPRGWHWFWAFKKLSGLNLEKIQKKLPEEHPFKSIKFRKSFLISELTDAILLLKKELKTIGDIKETTEDIKEINFFRLGFKNINFAYFIFPIKVFFRETHFYEEADFTLAFFFDDVDFNGTIFNNKAVFDIAIFNAKLSSSKAVFKYIVFFTRVKFVGGVNFGGARFTSAVDFSDTIFFGEAFFDGIKTKTHANFTNTEFKTLAPSMHDAVLYSGIKWDRNVNLWPHPQIREDNETDKAYKNRIEKNQNAYENLSSHMKKLDKYHDEHFFFRQETRCRQQFEKNYFTYCSYWLYGKFANYGYGIESAVAAWFWHMVLGAYIIAIVAFINAWLACWKDGALVTAKSVLCSIPLSFANAHGFLPFHKGALKDCYELFDGNILFNIIWGFQTVLGIVFLFLLLTTIRIRFRLR